MEIPRIYLDRWIIPRYPCLIFVTQDKECYPRTNCIKDFLDFPENQFS